MNVIFDFDGTIANTMPILIDEYHKWAKPMKPLTSYEIEELRGMPPKEALKKLKISYLRTPGLRIFGKQIKKRIVEVEAFYDMYNVLHQLHAKHRLFVVSSNSKFNIETFLADQEIAECFDRTFAGAIGVHRKASALKKVMRITRTTAGDSFYVGDEVRDIAAAKKVNMRCIAVTWGYNNEKILSQYQPDYIARKPADLVTIIGG